MFSLTIVFGPGPMVWTLMFKTEEAAEDAALAVRSILQARGKDTNFSPISAVSLKDDFGQIAEVTTESLHGFMLENMEQSKLAHIERALHQARTQAKGAEIADSDPVLAQARRRAQGGMPIMQPMPTGFSPNGRFPS
jgi:hypothetical protein